MNDDHDDKHRGMFDGFERYVSASEEDYQQVVKRGLVVLDTNVLLNLYKYTAQARNDLLDVLERLVERLWLPHHVIEEFWRNRESVAEASAEQAAATCGELERARRSAEQQVREWANRVSITIEKRDELLAALHGCFKELATQIEATVDHALVEGASRTYTNPILKRLEKILRGRIGEPIHVDEREKWLTEGRRRCEARVPPGYKDADKADPSGDYIVWEQLLRHASSSKCDVLFVTAERKEDWWRKDGTELLGPRPELIDELRARAGTRLFMLRPERLLALARSALGVEVRDESLRDVATTDRASAGGAWTNSSIATLLSRLDAAGNVQADVIRYAATNGGTIDRATIYRICGFEEERSLRGFTRPVRRIADALKSEGAVANDAADVLEPIYDSDAWVQASGFRVPDALIPLINSSTGSAGGVEAAGEGAWPEQAAGTWT